MKYLSTRNKSVLVSFRDVVFSGYCPEGGLFVPEVVPDIENIEEWVGLSFLEVLFRTLRLFVDIEELVDEDLREIVVSSFANFDTKEIIGTKELQGHVSIAELFHGPSLAFKDHGISVLANMMEFFCEKEDTDVVVLVGTSGDTGGSAVEAVKHLKRLKLIVLYPKDMCSEFQVLQMTSCYSPNIRIGEVEGTSDDLDVPIKQCFLDPDLKQKYSLASMNSVNWVRILVQAAHFIYLSLRGDWKQPKTIVVPSGAAGNLAAGCIAAKMGFPVRLVAAVNENDLIARLLQNGELSPGDVKKTHASAMDIQIPYNIERILHFFMDDADKVKNIMNGFAGENSVVEKEILESLKKVIVGSFVVTNETIENTMIRCWEENKYLLCPHTAVAVSYIYSLQPEERERMICLATASPAKFRECIESINLQIEEHAILKKMKMSPKKFVRFSSGSDWLQLLIKLCDEVYAQ